jgi:hypothetical protein
LLRLRNRLFYNGLRLLSLRSQEPCLHVFGGDARNVPPQFLDWHAEHLRQFRQSINRGAEAARAGVAPHDGSEQIIPALLVTTRQRFQPEGIAPRVRQIRLQLIHVPVLAILGRGQRFSRHVGNLP